MTTLSYGLLPVTGFVVPRKPIGFRAGERSTSEADPANLDYLLLY